MKLKDLVDEKDVPRKKKFFLEWDIEGVLLSPPMGSTGEKLARVGISRKTGFLRFYFLKPCQYSLVEKYKAMSIKGLKEKSFGILCKFRKFGQ